MTESKPVASKKQLQESNALFANYLSEEVQFNDKLWVCVFTHVDPAPGEAKPGQSRVFKLRFFTPYEHDLVLNWALGRRHSGEWTQPEQHVWPPNSKVVDAGPAVQSLFERDSEKPEYKSLTIEVGADELKVKGLNYVFYEPAEHRWYNNHGGFFQVNFDLYFSHCALANLMKSNPPSVVSMVKEIITCETKHGSWTLMHRFNKCSEFLNRINIRSPSEVYYHMLTQHCCSAWLFVWLRYSAIRQLDWQRSYNTKPRELTDSQSKLLGNILAKIISLRNKAPGTSKRRTLMGSADLLRYMIGSIGKGGINGQQIRDEILNILHRHNISENNSHFYEQWHQKLHNNTTPDDIVICEAVLAYLKSNKMSQYWDTLKRGGVTRERLMSFERKVAAEPFYAPQLIPDLENFLTILKKVHSSTDLIIMAHYAMSRLGPGLSGEIRKILGNLGKCSPTAELEGVTAFRGKLHDLYANTGDVNAYKDLIFLDIALEHYARQLIERVIHIDLGRREYFRQAELLMDNLVMTFDWKELDICREELRALNHDIQVCDKDHFAALKVKGVVERIKRCLGVVVDKSFETLQQRAEDLGTACNCDKAFVAIFTEDVIRGSLFFALSMVVKKIEPVLRKTLGVNNWLFISPMTEVRGRVTFVKQLRTRVDDFAEPTIILTESISGEEEVPAGVKGLVLINNSDYPDVLAHVSVRARNGKVLFAVCLDLSGKIAGSLRALEDKYARLTQMGSNIEIAEISATEVSSEETTERIPPKLVEPDSDVDQYIIPAKDFTPLKAGGKSNNLGKIRDKIEPWIQLPDSIALRFNAAEAILAFPENSEIKEKLDQLVALVQTATNGEAHELLEKCKEQIMKLQFPQNEKGTEMKRMLVDFGIPEADVVPKAWNSIKRVLASKYNERARIATRKIGVELSDIRMAVLIQKIVPAEYAFVIHTKNPLTGNKDEIYAEVVRGLGETLVGRYAGQAFSFVVTRKDECYKVLSVFNKSVGIKTAAGAYMFRSDSNTEDLDGFAGAGLFDSFPSEPSETFPLYYSNDKILTDVGFRDYFIKQIGRIGNSIEKVYDGQPQDIEGCYADNKFYVVQTRPQV